MKLLNFKKDNEISIGLLTEKGILDINKAAKKFNKNIPKNLDALVKDAKFLPIIEKIAEQVEKNNGLSSLYLSEDDIQFMTTILNPEKILCVGLNYLSHAEEAGFELPKAPVLFSKFNNSLAAHKQEIKLPKISKKIDYEAELVIIIGKEAKDVEEVDALSYVFGYSVGNDLSARDLQKASSQWLIGKTLDDFAPIGPYLATHENMDPSDLKIECKVNGETRQSSTTKDMIFDCKAIISYISKHMTLKPGDIIFTGTPQGVILGYPEDKQIWLKSGDVVEVTIENIGTLKNKLI